MVKISDEARETMNAPEKQYFGEGVHEVVITGVKKGESSGGTPRLEVTVTDAEGEGKETTAHMYVSEKAYPYTLRTLQAILVHNEKTDAAKQKVRDYFAKLEDTDQLQLTKLTMAQCWLKIEKTGETYVNAKGETKNRYDTNLFPYEPKWEPKAEQNIKAEDFPLGGEPLSNDEVAEVPFQ